MVAYQICFFAQPLAQVNDDCALEHLTSFLCAINFSSIADRHLRRLIISKKLPIAGLDCYFRSFCTCNPWFLH
jgi:hypothetical protein